MPAGWRSLLLLAAPLALLLVGAGGRIGWVQRAAEPARDSGRPHETVTAAESANGEDRLEPVRLRMVTTQAESRAVVTCEPGESLLTAGGGCGGDAEHRLQLIPPEPGASSWQVTCDKGQGPAFAMVICGPGSEPQ